MWVCSGIDEKLEKLTWRRFASGMFQTLGLRIIDGKVYTLGRDQITRLHDLNADGEADFYENFNNDVAITPGFHEFQFDTAPSSPSAPTAPSSPSTPPASARPTA